MKKARPLACRDNEQELWRQFEATGSVQQYLRYREAYNAKNKEQTDANHNNGVSIEGSEGRRS